MISNSKINILLYTLLFISGIFLMSCEDVIDVELEETESVIVVDAWLNNIDSKQTIKVSESQTYFDNGEPVGITNASVTVIRSDGKVFTFTSQGDGTYIAETEIDSLGFVGDEYQLAILIDGIEYSADSKMNRVPVIDSIGVEFRDDELFSDDGLYANFYARDPKGTGDAYWIKTYANDLYLDKATELNLAFDAGFDAGTGIDGITFITPIREVINRLDEDGLVFPYVTGETIRVEIHSISVEAFNFMEIVRDQINNSQNGIFSLPLANARTNMSASDGSGVVGFFNVAAVSLMEKLVE
ncbi:MAG: hypothetical protein ACI9FN_000761 [Saprospiraceae bacterium]|jgi:hypothetical protein